MDDTSYVSLSLEKYNELYDKAKAYDEIKATEEPDNEIKVGDKVEIIDNKYNAKVGVVGEVIEMDEDGWMRIKGNDQFIWSTSINCVKKINEGEEK